MTNCTKWAGEGELFCGYFTEFFKKSRRREVFGFSNASLNYSLGVKFGRLVGILDGMENGRISLCEKNSKIVFDEFLNKLREEYGKSFMYLTYDFAEEIRCKIEYNERVSNLIK